MQRFTGQFVQLAKHVLGTILLLLPFGMLSGQVAATAEGHGTRNNDAPDYASQSVLHTGRWVKMAITTTGVHRLDAGLLTAMGFDPQSIDPRNIAIFGNGGRMLPEANQEPRYDDLFENAILVEGETDGSFDASDAVYFYAENTTEWTWSNNRFVHKVNLYADTNYYFLTVLDRQGKRIGQLQEPEAEASRETDSYLAHQAHESDLENLIMSGKEWYGEEFSKSHPERSFSFNFHNRLTERPLRFEIGMAGRSITETFSFSVWANEQPVLSGLEFLQLSIGNSLHAREVIQNITFSNNSDDVEFRIAVDAQFDNSEAWLNYLRINSWCRLVYAPQQQLLFSNPEVVHANSVARFNVAGTHSNIHLWDVSHPLLPQAQAFQTTASGLSFKAISDSLRSYVVFEPENSLQPARFESIENQNLHDISNADMLIITHPDFMDQAQELASVHYADDGLSSVVVNVEDIYTEFGGGKADLTAIRDFVRMVYQKSNQNLRYLMLFGDGSYDYKNRIANNTNYIPTYQAAGSLMETQSFVSDDYYGLMDLNEGADMIGTLDLGIGRFPVTNADEAQTMVEKVKHYLQAGTNQCGEWRNNITFMADDSDGNLHFNQAETLSNDVDTAYENLNITKIYLDSYKRVTVPGGYRYPDANTKLLEKINEGSLIVNYTGHGGITGLSDEKVFTIGEIENLQNLDKLPFFITATCEFSRFDNPGFVSAGERLLLNPNGGAIALMTTTRLAFAHSNFAINRRVYDEMFEANKHDIRRLGDIIKLSKNPPSTYTHNFVLLGDPALRLNYPKLKVKLTEFNGRPTGDRNDTLGAMSEVRLKGMIIDANGLKDSLFNGILYPQMYDKKTRFKTLANDGNSIAANFSYFEKEIYEGRISISEGTFEMRFLIPRDIAYQFGKAKISFYAIDTSDFRDAGGYYDNIELGGFDANAVLNDEGPAIELYLNEPAFRNGDYSPPNPVLFVTLEDPQGIHHLGNSIGRNISLELDGPVSDHFYLDSYYQPDFDAFNRGSIVFPMQGLEEGTYQLTVKAWDLHNNSSDKTISFVVDSKARLQVTDLRNEPNPVSHGTQFAFTHNKPNQQLEVQIDIYNQQGMQVASFITETSSAGVHATPISWNGTDQSGKRLPAGLYIYTVTISDKDKDKHTASQKLMLLPIKE